MLYAEGSSRTTRSRSNIPQLCCEYGNVAPLLWPAFGDDVPVPGTGLALQLGPPLPGLLISRGYCEEKRQKMPSHAA
jgi:hypothetical protein